MTRPRRRFLGAASLAGAGFAVSARPVCVGVQGKPITASHSVSTFVYGQHLVARESWRPEYRGRA